MKMTINEASGSVVRYLHAGGHGWGSAKLVGGRGRIVAASREL
jgi:hypothetical protein